MGRRAFLDDLRDASVPGTFDGISGLCAGEDDGTVKFIVGHNISSLQELQVEVLLSDVTEYPSGHTYFVFTSSDNVPEKITNALQRVQDSITGCRLSKMLVEVSSAILRAPSEQPTEASSEGLPLLDCESDYEQIEDDDAEDGIWFDGEHERRISTKRATPAAALPDPNNQSDKARTRMRNDLRAVKQHGFKVGVLSGNEGGGIICISIRVAKLGISEEAMEAWGFQKQKYLVLLIRYGDGYRTLEEVTQQSILSDRPVQFVLGVCAQYKPSLKEANQSFFQHSATLNATEFKNQREVSDAKTEPGAVEAIFIAKPMEDLLKQLPNIIRCRRTWSLSWTGAELLASEMNSQSASYANIIDMDKYRLLSDLTSRVLPSLATADHLRDETASQSLSLPLVAMQFVVRHVVRCTEFCAVCHCRVESGFEALKPFVCSKPLCIYQYLTLGFGPSIEYEIVHQPYVVDLLISFCYTSARAGSLKDFPAGMRLKIPLIKVASGMSIDIPTMPVIAGGFPNLASIIAGPPSFAVPTQLPGPEQVAIPSPPTGPNVLNIRSIPVHINVPARKIRFTDQKSYDIVGAGDWVALAVVGSDQFTFHARIEQKHFPEAMLGRLIRHKLACSDSDDPTLTCPGASSQEELFATLHLYEHDFDDLDEASKMMSLLAIINTIPDVISMKARLETEKGTLLKDWRDRMSDTALNVLRWIISSNRSCLMQVDRDTSSSPVVRTEQRVTGMPQWMQFRFAQGAPDKEQRFVDHVNEVSKGLNNDKFPTIFAWHGSPLSNWHSIIREGLHFEKTSHGRAFGHGVYMSLDASTSMGYSGGGYSSGVEGLHVNNISLHWPRSRLQVNCAMALTEIVNAPLQFISRTPHLVVDKVDWIQTRYLFVRGNHREFGLKLHDSPPKSKQLTAVYQQDPSYTPRGIMREDLIIPITAVSKSRRPAEYIHHRVTSDGKKAKVIDLTNEDEAEKLYGDAASILTTASDAKWTEDLFDEDDEPALPRSTAVAESSQASAVVPRAVPETDFVPDSLDPSTLPLLKPPTNASSSATKSLLALLKTTLKIQSSTPPAELGWYITDTIISNIYQWPFELHSFPADLPLTTDLRAAKLTSIVLELRFPTSFPMAPPFVRVIRPRFLPFLAGGGGHVTAGGALCMELLTNTGWSPANSLESILLQVRMAICSTDPRPARLEMATSASMPGITSTSWQTASRQTAVGGQYGVMEAVAAYKRACLTHAWEIPKDFDDFLTQS